MLKKFFILIIAVLVLCAVPCALLANQSSAQRGLIVTLFTPELQKASDEFYSHYLSSTPTVANYFGKVLSLKKNDHGYYIKFGITPYLGPHISVGDDEVTYFVNNIGDITLLDFAHKKSYELPPRLGVSVKKPMPID